jgi:hypothetical protein
MVSYLSSRGVGKIGKNNYFVSLTKLCIPVPYKVLFYLLDLRKFKEDIPDCVLRERDLLIDVLLVSLTSYNAHIDLKHNKIQYSTYRINEFREKLNLDIKLVFVNRIGIAALTNKDIKYLANKILNLQLKKGLFELRGNKLIPTKKWEKLRKDLRAFERSVNIGLLRGIRIRNTPINKISKDNEFVDLQKLDKGFMVGSFALHLCGRDRDKIFEENKKILTKALLVLLGGYKGSSTYWNIDDYKDFLFLWCYDMVNNLATAKKMSDKLVKLQLKEGLFKLRNRALIPTKKWKKLEDDLSPFIDYLID